MKWDRRKRKVTTTTQQSTLCSCSSNSSTWTFLILVFCIQAFILLWHRISYSTLHTSAGLPRAIYDTQSCISKGISANDLLTHHDRCIPSLHIEGLKCKRRAVNIEYTEMAALRHHQPLGSLLFHWFSVYQYNILIKLSSLNHMPIKPQLCLFQS